MSLSTNSSVEVKFMHCEYFLQNGSLDEWYCNICTPPRKGNVDYMTLKAAQHHERHSTEHARNIAEVERRKWIYSDPDPSAWEVPLKYEPALSKEEMKMRESQLHVDLVRDMVPFWIRGVEAAERGEVLRLEDFLEKLETSASEWGGSGGDVGWGEGVNGVRRRQQDNAYQFVEKVARQVAADEGRRRRMHCFFEVRMHGLAHCTTKTHPSFQMPTQEKIRKIDEAIRALTS
ncbi:hypothetical protein C0991_005122 [Blastosporella zonata]|nr:hypothetical protein C0991_005122 [Blastosporella zonata]